MCLKSSIHRLAKRNPYLWILIFKRDICWSESHLIRRMLGRIHNTNWWMQVSQMLSQMCLKRFWIMCIRLNRRACLGHWSIWIIILKNCSRVRMSWFKHKKRKKKEKKRKCWLQKQGKKKRQKDKNRIVKEEKMKKEKMEKKVRIMRKMQIMLKIRISIRM